VVLIIKEIHADRTLTLIKRTYCFVQFLTVIFVRQINDMLRLLFV